jgi:hypothetical protein
MRRLVWVIALGLLAASAAGAQDDAAGDGLVAEDVRVVEGIGMFEQPVQTVVGTLVNRGDESLIVGEIIAEAYVGADALIGEGFGVAINACGAGLLDVALRPGEFAAFSAPLELFEPDAEIERLEVSASSTPTTLPDPPAMDGIDGTRIFTGEAVTAEWWTVNGAPTLLFAAGCARDSFLEWTWYRYDAELGVVIETPHPRADEIDPEALPERLLLRDDLAWQNAFIRVAPDMPRFVYQDQVNTFFTAEMSGRFIRPLHGRLNSRTLQGIYWLPEGRFLASYYGAYGDPVLYFTADVEGRFISPPPSQNPPSEIVPGVSADARRIMVAGDFEDGRGYYLYVVTNGFFEKLFDAVPPGSNYPSPLLVAEAEGEQRIVQALVALADDDGAARLVCFNRDSASLTDLGGLPLELMDDERAQWWRSPDGDQIVLAANGRHGGVWLMEAADLQC